MALSHDTLMERETTIRWDETGEPATLWTASSKTRKDWLSHGFPVTPYGGGWICHVPPDRIVYRMFKKQV